MTDKEKAWKEAWRNLDEEEQQCYEESADFKLAFLYGWTARQRHDVQVLRIHLCADVMCPCHDCSVLNEAIDAIERSK